MCFVVVNAVMFLGGGRGLFGGNDNIVYWKCECSQQLNETLSVPVTNPAREKALVIAAQQVVCHLWLN